MCAMRQGRVRYRDRSTLCDSRFQHAHEPLCIWCFLCSSRRQIVHRRHKSWPPSQRSRWCRLRSSVCSSSVTSFHDTSWLSVTNYTTVHYCAEKDMQNVCTLYTNFELSYFMPPDVCRQVFVFYSWLIWQTCFTGFEFQNGSSSRWPRWHFVLCTVRRRLYTTSQFTRVADMPNRRRLQSASFNQLDVPSFRLPTVGSRAFPIAGAKVWNSLPDDVTSAPSLSIFRRHLKTYLFRCLILLVLTLTIIVVLVVALLFRSL